MNVPWRWITVIQMLLVKTLMDLLSVPVTMALLEADDYVKVRFICYCLFSITLFVHMLFFCYCLFSTVIKTNNYFVNSHPLIRFTKFS